MPRQTPLCSKCGKEHWNYTKCEEQAEKRAPEIVRQPREDGFSEWGDRFETLERRGENVFLNADNTTTDRGLLTGPPGWVPPEAA